MNSSVATYYDKYSILHYIMYSRPGLKYISRIKDKKICKNNSIIVLIIKSKTKQKKTGI